MTIHIIRLSDLLVRSDRNARFATGLGAEALRPEETSFTDFVRSFVERGQDTPILVRERNARPGQPCYELIAGYRRVAAFQEIYRRKERVLGVPDGRIRAKIRNDVTTDADVWELNVRENTGRTELNDADLAYGIGQICKAWGGRIENRILAKRVGLSEARVEQLRRVYEGLQIAIETGKPATIFSHWRANPGLLKFSYMLRLVDCYEPAERVKVYRKACVNGWVPATARRARRDKKAWEASMPAYRKAGEVLRLFFGGKREPHWKTLLEHAHAAGLPVEATERAASEIQKGWKGEKEE